MLQPPYPQYYLEHVNAWIEHNIKISGPDYNAKFWDAEDMCYQATWGDYDLDCKVGYGSTPADARDDLLAQLGY